MADKDVEKTTAQIETVTQMVPGGFGWANPIDASMQIAEGFVLDITPAQRRTLALEKDEARDRLLAQA